MQVKRPSVILYETIKAASIDPDSHLWQAQRHFGELQVLHRRKQNGMTVERDAVDTAVHSVFAHMKLSALPYHYLFTTYPSNHQAKRYIHQLAKRTLRQSRRQKTSQPSPA